MLRNRFEVVLASVIAIACTAPATPSVDAAAPDADVDDASTDRDGGGDPASDASASSDATQTDTSDAAPVFDGVSGYVEIPDDDVFSQPTSGALTVEAWMRPDSLSMPSREGSGYVHWMGKGESGEHEWVARMYQEGNAELRENRISFYAFNLGGGLGAGSYFQDPISAGDWIHYAGAFDDTYTYIDRDGVQRDSDLLSGYDIVPENGSAPVRIGTRDLHSFFQGSIARVAIYSARLDEAQIRAHVDAASTGDYDDAVLAEPSLVAFYPLNETEGDVAHDVVGGRDGRYVGGVALGAASWLDR